MMTNNNRAYFLSNKKNIFPPVLNCCFCCFFVHSFRSFSSNSPPSSRNLAHVWFVVLFPPSFRPSTFPVRFFPFHPFLLLPPPSFPFQCPAMSAAIWPIIQSKTDSLLQTFSPHLRFSPPFFQSFSIHLATKMWRWLFLAIFLLLFPSKPSLVPISSQGILGGSHPEPKVWICEGHIGQQQFFQNAQEILPYEGQIVVGHEYTLVLEMSIIMRWDFLVDTCTCNQRGIFLERGGCLRADGNWLAKQEFRRGQSKYILIHFFAPEPILRIQCQTRVVQCCGCCENFCERLMPPLDPFPSFPVPISCSYPIGLPPPLPPQQIPPPSIVAIPGGLPSSQCWLPFLNQCPSSYSDASGSFPFWLLILLICLFFFLLLICICCLLAQLIFCGWGWAGGRRFRERIWPIHPQKAEEIHPPPPIPPPPAPETAPSSPPPPSQRIFVVDQSAQTNNNSNDEFRQQMPNSPPPPPPSIPIPDYDQRREEGGKREFSHFEQCHSTTIPLRDNWPPPPPRLTPWWRIREVEEFEEREMVEEREEEEWTTTEGITDNARPKQQHYENWLHEHGGGRNNNNGWTQFSTEPMTNGNGRSGTIEEEDRFQWRTTTPDGAQQRGVDHHRVHFERSAF